MLIEVLLPTFNRADLLPRAIDSYLAAVAPEGAGSVLTVVDNNSRDHTRTVIEGYAASHPGRVRYLFAPVQGRENALAAGVSQSVADVLAMFDDDEEVQEDWLQVLARNFADPALDYVGGEMRPNWLVPRPDWLPPAFRGAVGIVRNGDERRRFGSPDFHAMPVGGNMAVRRSTLVRCKPWSMCNLPHAEDRFMFNELQRIGAVGFYDPALVILHQIPAKRVTKQYHRFWATLEGRTNARTDRDGPSASRRLLRVPLWRWRRAAGCLVDVALRRGGPAGRMQAELQLREFWGYLTTMAGWAKENPEYRSSLK